MGDFPCLGHDDNKTLSHKIIKGGNMRIGTLVRWTAHSDEDYGCIGVVFKKTIHQFWVNWADGEVVDYMYGEKHTSYVEVICE